MPKHCPKSYGATRRIIRRVVQRGYVRTRRTTRLVLKTAKILKRHRLFRPKISKVKTSIVAQIPVCVKHPNAECGR